MGRKLVLLVYTSILILSCKGIVFQFIRPTKASPTTWTVDDDAPADFHTIQEAINAATDGDTIFVYNGTYYEHLLIDKSISFFGEDKHGAVLGGNRATGPIIRLKRYTDNVNISGFTIRNSGSPGLAIQLYYSSYNNITNNIIVDNSAGILIERGSGNILIRNKIANSRYFGILLKRSPNSILENNAMVGNNMNFGVKGWSLGDFMQDVDSSNTVNGKPIYYWINHHTDEVPSDAGFVAVVNSTDINITGLVLSDNYQGINLAYTSQSILKNVTVTGSHFGISMAYCRDNVLTTSKINSSYYGVWLANSTNNILAHNTVNNCEEGIILGRHSSNNIISTSNVANNSYGIAQSYSSGNRIYHNNLINNNFQVFVEGEPVNAWDNGYPSGGNYWSDYTGNDTYSAPYQNETGGDGIGDTPYIIDENNQDNYPLMQPWGVSPGEAIKDLIEDVKSMNLQQGIDNSLDAKLDAALESLEALNADQRNDTINKLCAFINSVEAQRDKKLTDEQADYLIARAQEIINLIE